LDYSVCSDQPFGGIASPLCLAVFNLDRQSVIVPLYLTEPGPVYRL
jgi:hypothetical protein